MLLVETAEVKGLTDVCGLGTLMSLCVQERGQLCACRVLQNVRGIDCDSFRSQLFGCLNGADTIKSQLVDGSVACRVDSPGRGQREENFLDLPLGG